MVLIVYIGMFLYGIYAGYISSFDLDNENEVIAALVFFAVLGSLTVLFFAPFQHVFSAFFLWLVVSFLISEGLKFIRSIR